MKPTTARRLRRDELRGALGFDRVGVGRRLHRRAGAGAGDAGFAGHDGAARDGVRGEEDGDAGSDWAQASAQYGARAVGEGLGEGGLFGPSSTK